MSRHTFKIKAKKSRRQSGNMLILGSVVMALVGLGLMIGYSYGGLVFTHNRLQASADEIALAGARKLNDGDRIGQMNNMIARSRQLVYESRLQRDRVETEYPQLIAIAQQLLDESRDSAEELESQRKHLKIVAQNEALIAMEKKFDQIKGTYPMSLPWMKVSSPQLVRMRLGRLENVESNVEELKNIKELETWDKERNYVKDSPGLRLYRRNCKAELPGPEADLKFYMCSLAPPVQKTVSPAHISLAKSYKQVQEHEIASCTQVKITLNVATGLGAQAQSDLSAMSTAAATGASPQQ